MPFSVLHNGRTAIFEITHAESSATVGDLLAAITVSLAGDAEIAPPTRLRLSVDGTELLPSTPLSAAGLKAGSAVELESSDAAVPAVPADAAATLDGIEPAEHHRCVESRNKPVQSDEPVLHLRVSGGLHAGETCSVTEPLTIGRGRGDVAAGDAPVAAWGSANGHGVLVVDDPTVSARHLMVAPAATGPQSARAVICDAGSLNGTFVDGLALVPGTPATVGPGSLIRCGASELTLTQPDPAGGEDSPEPLPCTNPTLPGQATLAFHRPPRAAVVPNNRLIHAPRLPQPAAGATPLGVATLLVPLIFAGAAIAWLGSWLWGLFALLGPVALLATYVDQRVHGRRRRRADEWRFAAALRTFEQRLADATEHERIVRRTHLPDPSEVAATATRQSPRLWERRCEHGDALVLHLGRGSVLWSPPVKAPEQASDGEHDTAALALQAVLERHARLSDCSVPLSLRGGAVIGIAGPRHAQLAVGRSLLLQLATLHGPADVDIAVITEAAQVEHWKWAVWLPHVSDHGSTSFGSRLVTDPADEVLTRLLAAHSAGPPGESPRPLTDRPRHARAAVLLVDNHDHLRSPRTVARRLLSETCPDVAGIVLAERTDQLPSICSVVVEVDSFGCGRLRGGAATAPVSDLRAAGITERVAWDAARSLAQLSDPERTALGADLPRHVGLIDLLDLHSTSPTEAEDQDLTSSIRARWAAHTPSDPVIARLGRAATGLLSIDLDRDGPHALVAGTTGSGKSELLRTLVLSLALTYPPDTINFVLVDFKGGSAFARCETLPHTAGMVTDLDSGTAARAVRGLERELHAREQLLKREGAVDLAELRMRPPSDVTVPPRLLIVVDEFATLAAQLPDVLSSLVSIAQRGRSLGLHLVLATQRPAGIISDQIRTNTALRIALRLPDERDSLDVLDSPVAVSIGRDLPGRAFIRFGPEELEEFQVAAAEAASGTDVSSPVGVERLDHHQLPRTQARPPLASAQAAIHDRGPRTLLDVLATAARAASCIAAKPLWSSPLPQSIDFARLTRAAASATGVLSVALVDRADESGHDIDGWRPGDGPLLVTGPLGSGVTNTLLALLTRAAAGDDPTWTVHVVQGADAGLAGCGHLPGVANLIASSDRERQRRLFHRLFVGLLRGGHRDAAAEDGPLMQQLLVIDDAGGLIRAWDDPLDSVLEELSGLIRGGRQAGLHVALGADRPGAVPADWRAGIGAHWLLGACAVDHLGLGTPGGGAGAAAQWPAGRAVMLPTGRLAQIAHIPSEHLAPLLGDAGRSSGDGATPSAASPGRGRANDRGVVVGTKPDPPQARGQAASSRRAETIGILPEAFGVSRLWEGHADSASGPSQRESGGQCPTSGIPIGLGNNDLSAVGLAVATGGCALVAGPPRSGRTNTLRVLEVGARRLGLSVITIAVRTAGGAPSTAPINPRGMVVRPAPSRGWLSPEEGGAIACERIDRGEPVLALIDDLDFLDEQGSRLSGLLRHRPEQLTVIAATRVTSLRSAFGHVVRDLRADRTGVLLSADLEVDGDLLGTRLPRRLPAPAACGRGWLVNDGVAEYLQVALADANAGGL